MSSVSSRAWSKLQLQRVKSNTFTKTKRSSHELSQSGLLDNTVSIQLQEFAMFLENEPKKALPFLQGIINRNTDSGKPWLMAWTDNRGFDILQLAIVNNRADIINGLLGKAELFPESYSPQSNPYAHLAAIIGFKDCLHAILTHRPSDNFEVYDSHHVIRLPIIMMQRMKLNQTGGMNDKDIDRLITIVKEETAVAETAIDVHWGGRSEEQILEGELKRMHKSRKKQPKRAARVYGHFSPQAPVVQLGKDQSPSTSQEKITSKQSDNNLYRRLLALKKRRKKVWKPKITVFWDVFKDEGEGVVKGAGEKIDVVQCDIDDANSHLHMQTIVDRKDIKLNKKKMAHKRESESQAQASHYKINNTPRTSVTSVPRDKSSRGNMKPPATINRIELGVRRIKKYKDFVPVFESRPTHVELNDIGKTPLTFAAERGHIDCVHYLLELMYSPSRRSSTAQTREPLTLATKARSPEAIAALLAKEHSRADYHSAIMMSIRELYPDCLAILLALGTKDRNKLLEGNNLFHLLYSQSLVENYRYELLPEMTRVLINNREDVNSHGQRRTFPIYTLIKCTFNVDIGPKYVYYLKCLKMLLKAKANPHFDEEKGEKTWRGGVLLSLSRQTYKGAIQCVLINARCALQHFERPRWAQIIMQKCIEAIEAGDKTPRRVNNTILFEYMLQVCQLGLNRSVLRTLLRYGANPDYMINNKYPVNMFFDYMLPFLTQFQVVANYDTHDDMLDALLILCRAMTQPCLHDAVIKFLNSHLLSTPLQALLLTRNFCYHANKMITSPRSLSHLASQQVWLTMRRNVKKVRLIPAPSEILNMIIP